MEREEKLQMGSAQLYQLSGKKCLIWGKTYDYVFKK